MSIFEVVGGNDRRSMIKRYERKSNQQAISELVDLVHCNWRQVELLEQERDQLRAELSRIKAGHGEVVACSHGIRLPHECRDCADSQVVPYGWVEPVGGVFVDDFTKMCMRDRDASAYSMPLYTSPPSDPGTVPVPIEFVRFLLGESELNGYGFGEVHQVRIGKHWWRTELRALLAQSVGVK